MVLRSARVLVLPEGLVLARPREELRTARSGRWIAVRTAPLTRGSTSTPCRAPPRAPAARVAPTGASRPVSSGASEVEPTTVAAIALRDDQAREWLASHQRADGGFDEADGRTSGPSGAALAALVLGDAERARRALAFAIENRGLPLPERPRSGAPGSLGLDFRRAVPRRADVTGPAGGQCADSVGREHPRGSHAAARAAPVRRRRLELRQRVGLRRRPARIRADDGDRADRAAGSGRRARSTGDRVPASSMASGAGRPHGGASLGGVPVPAGRRRDPARARRTRGDGPPTGLSSNGR